MNSEEKIRVAVEKLDVVRAPMIAATLRRLLEEWPEAPEELAGAAKVAIAAIREHQKAERLRWVQA